MRKLRAQGNLVAGSGGVGYTISMGLGGQVRLNSAAVLDQGPGRALGGGVWVLNSAAPPTPHLCLRLCSSSSLWVAVLQYNVRAWMSIYRDLSALIAASPNTDLLMDV